MSATPEVMAANVIRAWLTEKDEQDRAEVESSLYLVITTLSCVREHYPLTRANCAMLECAEKLVNEVLNS